MPFPFVMRYTVCVPDRSGAEGGAIPMRKGIHIAITVFCMLALSRFLVRLIDGKEESHAALRGCVC